MRKRQAIFEMVDARALITVVVLLASVSAVLRAQADRTPPGRAPTAPPPNERQRTLAEFEGVYAYHRGHDSDDHRLTLRDLLTMQSGLAGG